MMNKKLSVIIPIYNTEKYLHCCVDSILNQTYKDLEVILVDDGSTDLSRQICDEYTKIDNRIRVVHKKNEGMVKARWDGVKLATSEYVTFVDSDDFIDPSMYENLMGKILSDDCDVAVCGCYRYRSDNDKVLSFDKDIAEGIYEKKDIDEKIIPIMLHDTILGTWGLDPSLCMKIFKTDIILTVYERIKDRFFCYGEDTSVIYPYILKCKKIVITHTPYYYHRQRDNGIVPFYFSDSNFIPNLYSLYDYLRNVFCEDEHYSALSKQLDYFMVRSTKYALLKYNDYCDSGKPTECIVFPFDKIRKNDSIVLYGAGVYGKEYYRQILKTQYCKIVMWVDKCAGNMEDKRVSRIDQIRSLNNEYDRIVISNKDTKIRDQIIQELVKMGVELQKITY